MIQCVTVISWQAGIDTHPWYIEKDMAICRDFRLRELMFLVKGIFVSLKALAPSLVLILLFLYMSALFIFRVLGRKAAEDPETEEDMDKWFGTVGRSLFTLFQLLSAT